ncbi:alpha/beta fold hydrolase [Streptomyces sp. NPDC003077]|uniref:thioesterase II family protein n=1 Tax=Streptomyces sp. NPDC003077 TaxID=3154443 RepID=UPI0033B9699F
MTATNPATSTWLRSYHPAPQARHRLVCFPHAGGSATFFHPVSARLAPEIEVLSLQYPGRQDRRHETAIPDIAGLADRVAAEIGALTGPRPVFFGHSMGAVLAFEVAHRLEQDDRGPLALVLSGRRAPSTHRVENVHQRDDEGVITELKLLSGTNAALLGDEEILRMILPAIRSDYRAIETYTCPEDRAVACPVTVFTGDADPRTTLDEARAWERHTRGTFDLEVFPGGHFYLGDRPAEVTDAIARRVRAAAPAPTAHR